MSGDGLPTDFPLVEQGYDPDRVDEYVANHMLQLRTELDSARHRIEELEAQLALDKEAEDALKMALVVVKRTSDEMLSEAKAQADDIIGKARREAFIIMTESRNDAESSMDDGKAIVARARDEALHVITEVEAETERLITERNQALQKMRDDYEAESSVLIDRINTLRSIAADLQARSAPAPAPAPSPTPQDPPSPPTAEGRTAVAPPGDDAHRDDGGDAPSAAKIRESFSGRRSAKLPRIGEEAGRSALAAATAMRAHLTHEPDDSDSPGDDDLAVRTA